MKIFAVFECPPVTVNAVLSKKRTMNISLENVSMDDLMLCCTFVHVGFVTCSLCWLQISSVYYQQTCGYRNTLTVCLCVVGGHSESEARCLISTNMRRPRVVCTRGGDVFMWEFDFLCWAACVFSSCLGFISVSHQQSATSSCLSLPSHITNTHTEWAAISDAPPFSPPLFPPVALLQPHLLWVRPILLATVVTGRLWWRARWQGLLEEGWGFGFGHFVKEGEISHIFSWGRQGDDGGELVAPEDLIRKIGGSNLAGSGGRLNRGTHDHQQLKVSQLRVCPTTWRTEDTWG